MPKDRSARIEELATRLEGALGSGLVSLVEFGATARGHHVADSDINLLLVVRDASAGGLKPAAEAIARWTARGNPAPLIFSEQEWHDSADVFPIEIEDIREAHRVVRGRDPVEGLPTRTDDLRRQLEREVRGKLLHLRAHYAAAAADRKALEQLLLGSVSTIFVLFRATLRIKGIAPPAQLELLVRETGAVTGLDTGAFDWALARRAGRAAAPLQAFDPLGARYLDAIERLAHFVNQL
jgi:hypothetical protein